MSTQQYAWRVVNATDTPVVFVSGPGRDPPPTRTTVPPQKDAVVPHDANFLGLPYGDGYSFLNPYDVFTTYGNTWRATLPSGAPYKASSYLDTSALDAPVIVTTLTPDADALNVQPSKGLAPHTVFLIVAVVLGVCIVAAIVAVVVVAVRKPRKSKLTGAAAASASASIPAVGSAPAPAPAPVTT
jgi:hypothetical protein